MKRCPLFFFLIIFLWGCSKSSEPANVIKEDRMVDVLTDLHLADGYSSTFYNDSTGTKSALIYAALYKKYQLDSASLRHNIDYYAKHPDIMVKLYDSVNNRLNIIQSLAMKAESQRYRMESKRRSDSLYYHDARLDSIYKGIIMDTMSYGPFTRYSLRKKIVRGPVRVNIQESPADSVSIRAVN